MAFTTDHMALRVWNNADDLYDHAQLADNWMKVEYHDHSSGRGVQIPTEGIEDHAITAAKLDPAAFGSLSVSDGSITAGKLDATLAANLGVSQAGAVHGGKSTITATGTRTNVAYGALDNGPDSVTSVVLPADGVIFVLYRAAFTSSISAAGSAAVFLNTNQIVSEGNSTAAPAATTAGTSTRLLTTYENGLIVSSGTPTDVTTGQTVGAAAAAGGPITLYATAGTYDVSVQFKATSGSISASNRRLWVWTKAFN